MKIALYIIAFILVNSLGSSFGLPAIVKYSITTVLLVLLVMSIINRNK